jgi:hypothetical protein
VTLPTKVGGKYCLSEKLAFAGQKKQDKKRTGSVLLTSDCFWGMIWLIKTIDASVVREMNL